MANRLPTPCANSACPEITTDRYCEDHSSEKWRADDRDSASDRGYDSRWQKVRNRYIRRHPLCEHCLEQGRTTPGQDVDHIRPLSRGGARLDPDNLQTLCRACHNRKTSSER